MQWTTNTHRLGQQEGQLDGNGNDEFQSKDKGDTMEKVNRSHVDFAK